MRTNEGLLTCRARGRFRKDAIKPMVGDKVICRQLSSETGVLEDIVPRKNYLQRPPVANVDQVLVMAAVAEPSPNLMLIDRLLVTSEHLGLQVLIGFNKADLDINGQGSQLQDLYAPIGYPCVLFSLCRQQVWSNCLSICRENYRLAGNRELESQL